MDKLDVDLDPSDLAPFLPPSPGPSELGTVGIETVVSSYFLEFRNKQRKPFLTSRVSGTVYYEICCTPKCLEMKVVCVLSVAAASTSDSVQKLVENYRVLRSGILQHTLKIPLFHPNQSDEGELGCYITYDIDVRTETAEITKKYAAEHSALRLKLSVLRTRMDKLCR